MDLTRLCVRLSVADTGCRGPHLLSDIVTCLVNNDYDTTVASVTHLGTVLRVNGQNVEIRHNAGPGQQWYMVRRDAKVVCLSPFRTETVVVGITVADKPYAIPIHETLYMKWSAGTRPTWESVKADFPTIQSWVSAPVTFVEPMSFVKAIGMVLEATSAA